MVDTRQEHDDLLALYLPIALAVTALVFGLVLFAVVRYRHREGRAPSQRTEAPLVEGLYVAVLAVVAAVLVVATFRTEARVDRVSDRPALRIGVTAAKWTWRFDYPGGVSEVAAPGQRPTLVVPTGATVRFDMASIDVIHAFWLPPLRFQRDALPGQATSFDLVFPEPGLMDASGQCGQYCGLRHTDMRFNVHALDPAAFDAWLRERQAMPRPSAPPAVGAPRAGDAVSPEGAANAPVAAASAGGAR